MLIHAAGIAPGAKAEDISLEQWHQAMAVNATGTFLTNQAVFPHLKDRGGAILNFASAAGVKGYPNKAAYAAAKGAVVAWTRSIAVEWGCHNIRVNGIAPAIWTPMYDKTRASMTPEELEAHDAALKAAIPLGGKLGDIARDFVPVVAFFVGFWFLGAIINRGGWGHWVVWGLLVGVVSWGGYVLGALFAAPFWMLNARQGVDLVQESVLAPLAIVAFVLGRELTIWFGAWVAKRGRRVTEINDEAQREYERTLEAGPQLSQR